MLVLSDEKYSLNSHGYIYTRWNLTENTGEHQHLYYEVIFVFFRNIGTCSERY